MLFHAVEEAVTVYRCPNKRVDARAVYTNTVPAGAFRGYGLSQTVFAVESAIDELARSLGIDPAEFRRRNLIRRGRRAGQRQRRGAGRVHRQSSASSTASTWWRRPWPSGARRQAGAGRVGDRDRDRGGDAGHHPARRPPGRSRVAERPDGGYAAFVGTAEFGNGTTTIHRQLAADVLGCEPGDVLIFSSDTDRSGTTPAPTARPGSRSRAPRRCGRRGPWPTRSRRGRPAASRDGKLLEAEGYCDGRSRSVSFTVQGFRVAVCAATGEIRVLQIGAGGRRGDGAQPGAAARPGGGRGRRRPWGRRCSRRSRSTAPAGRHPGAARVPRAGAGGRAADRGAVRRRPSTRSARSGPSR